MAPEVLEGAINFSRYLFTYMRGIWPFESAYMNILFQETPSSALICMHAVWCYGSLLLDVHSALLMEITILYCLTLMITSFHSKQSQ